MKKSLPIQYDNLDSIGRSYYAFCLEVALDAVNHCRELVKDDITDTNHELPTIQKLLQEALDVT